MLNCVHHLRAGKSAAALVTAAGCAVLPFHHAVAQETPATLATIVVTERPYQGIGTSDSASAGVIFGEEINELPLLRPADVLENIPGLVVTQHSGDGKANQYYLRGFNLDHGTDFATTIQGVPVNMPTNAHGQGYTDLNYLIPELIDRVDFRKGPYFAQNSDFSSAGSADFYYKSRLDQNIANMAISAQCSPAPQFWDPMPTETQAQRGKAQFCWEPSRRSGRTAPGQTQRAFKKPTRCCA